MKKVFVISNMYPSKEHLSFGIFVKNQVEALSKSDIDVLVAANDNPATGKKNTILKYSKWALQTLSKAFKVIARNFRYTCSLRISIWCIFVTIKEYFNIPYIVTAHGGDIERMAKKSARIRNWTEKILQESEHVIAVGPVVSRSNRKGLSDSKGKNYYL